MTLAERIALLNKDNTDRQKTTKKLPFMPPVRAVPKKEKWVDYQQILMELNEKQESERVDGERQKRRTSLERMRQNKVVAQKRTELFVDNEGDNAVKSDVDASRVQEARRKFLQMQQPHESVSDHPQPMHGHGRIKKKFSIFDKEQEAKPLFPGMPLGVTRTPSNRTMNVTRVPSTKRFSLVATTNANMLSDVEDEHEDAQSRARKRQSSFIGSVEGNWILDAMMLCSTRRERCVPHLRFRYGKRVQSIAPASANRQTHAKGRKACQSHCKTSFGHRDADGEQWLRDERVRQTSFGDFVTQT
jgi:hypothetical protein